MATHSTTTEASRCEGHPAGPYDPHEHAPIVTDRETARAKLTAKIASQQRLLADPHAFATIDPNYIIADAEFRLRWIDCAPEGANHCLAPMQDKRGVPMGGVFNENVGPCKNLREARIARGRHPFAPVETGAEDAEAAATDYRQAADELTP